MKALKIVLIILVAIILAIGVFAWYIGFFKTITVEEKEMGPYQLVAVEHYGDYAETGKIQDSLYYELLDDGIETLKGFGIYYDNPNQTDKPTEELYSIVGCVLEKKDYDKAKQLSDKYRIMTMGRTKSMVAEFPYHNSLSVIAGIYKVYPELNEHLQKQNYKPQPAMEIYDIPNNKIIYIMAIAENE